MERPRVLLALADSLAPQYTEALTKAGFTVVSDVAPGDPMVDLAVLDCDLEADHASAIHAALHDAGQVPTLLLVSDEPPEWVMAQGGTGIHDELALKPLVPEALVYRLQALLIRGGSEVPNTGTAAWIESADAEQGPIGEGHVVTVYAPKGGVGKTTIAVNMAVALREQSKSAVLLLDTDIGVGNVSSVLEAPYRMGLADLADSPPEEWNDAAFEHAVTTHAASGVRILTWGQDPAQSERISTDLLLAAVRWARHHHAFVVIDTHPGYDDRTLAMLSVASEIFLVITPEVGAVRNSAQFLALARDIGLRDMVRVIVNRANHGIGSADIVAALGLPISASIVSDGRRAVIASNEGLPVITKFPREKISTDLHQVARLLTQPPAPQAASKSRRWFTPAPSGAPSS